MQILRLPEVVTRIGYRRAKVYSLMREGKFPKSIALGSRARGWLADEVDNWIRERVSASRQSA